jgi:hypothetical protein
MKKFTIILVAMTMLLAAFQISSCKKKEDEKAKIAFTINGASDQTFYGGDLVLSIKTGYTSGTQEPVTLSISGLPAGISGSFSSPSGTPEFYSSLTLKKTGSLTAGKYTVIITGRSNSGVERSASFILTVVDDCANGLEGNYSATYTGFSSVYNYVVVKPSSTTNTLKFYAVEFPADSFKLTLDCSKQTCFSDDGGIGTFSSSPKKFVLNYGSEVLTITAK